MKKRVAIVMAGALFSAPAMAQTSTVDAILGPQGPVQGLITTLGTGGDAQPLIDGIASDSGLVQGAIAGSINTSLTGLVVNQDPGQIPGGLENTVSATLGGVSNGLFGTSGPQQVPDALTGVLIGLVPAGSGGELTAPDGLPGLDFLDVNALSDSAPGADSLPALPGLSGTGASGLSPEQLGSVTDLLGG